MKRSVLLTGVNDLATLHPEVAVFWSKENQYSAENFLPGSPIRVKWECPEGHSWTNVIRQEVKKSNHCKECERNRNKPIITFENLEQKYSINNLKAFSSKLPKTRPLLWDCNKCDTEYAQTLDNELKNVGCPYCSGKKIKAGLNDIATLFPDLVRYWDKKNDSDIAEHGKGSQRLVSWNCPECLGEWNTIPAVQTRKNPNSYCPYCSGNKLLSGLNDFATLYPTKAKQFHSSRNDSKKAEHFLPSSYETVWWINETCGHEWKQPIVNRIGSLTECPVCSGETILKGLNSLLDVKPYLAEYWDYDNNVQDPFALSPSSNMTIYLKCDLGHNWKTTPQTVSETITCQVCANKQLLVGYNDLPTTHPKLAAEWHPTKNLPLTPQDVTAGTHTRINWICEKGHEWVTKGNDRVTYNTGCPECIPHNKSQAEDDIAAWLQRLGYATKGKLLVRNSIYTSQTNK